ncbi:MAG: response regulator transcription factor [Candidatus Sericytochromatia bacterium]
MKILIVEDEIALAKIVKMGLEENFFYVDLAHDGEIALDKIIKNEYSAIILDLSLPKKDGISILKFIRENNYNTPVLILTAKNNISNKIEGFNSGADDYITKPFDFSELLVRLNAIIRRSKGKANSIIKIKDLEIDMNKRIVKRNHLEIKLSNKEYNLLQFLALNNDRVITRFEISENLYDFETDSNMIDVYINYLRNKIDKDFEYKLIKTIRGTGYILQ